MAIKEAREDFDSRPGEWLVNCGHGPVSLLGQRVAFVLAKMAGGGIYNAPVAFHRVNWNNEQFISCHWRGGLSSWDSTSLAVLFGWSAELMMRVEINPASPTHIELLFHPRSSRDGGMMKSLPAAREILGFIGL